MPSQILESAIPSHSTILGDLARLMGVGLRLVQQWRAGTVDSPIDRFLLLMRGLKAFWPDGYAIVRAYVLDQLDARPKVVDSPAKLTLRVVKEYAEAHESELAGQPVRDQLREWRELRGAVDTKIHALEEQLLKDEARRAEARGERVA